MNPTILIDGYNLLYGAGIVGEGTDAGTLQSAREALLGWLLHSLPQNDRQRTVVVFDAHHPPPGRPSIYDRQGLTVHFSRDHENADALLEEATSRTGLTDFGDEAFLEEIRAGLSDNIELLERYVFAWAPHGRHKGEDPFALLGAEVRANKAEEKAHASALAASDIPSTAPSGKAMGVASQSAAAEAPRRRGGPA